MRILSALDAISPAFGRTKLVLFSPFRWGRTWKFSAVSYFSFAGTMYFPFTLLSLALVGVFPASDRRVLWEMVAAVALGGTLFFGVIFYLCSRIQFPFFDIVLRREQFVTPGWKFYGARAMPWTLAKMGYGIVATLLMAAPATVWLKHVIPLFGKLSALKPNEPPPMDLLLSIYSGYGLLMLMGGAFFLIIATVSAFVLPSLALEDTTVGEALRRFFVLANQEPGQLALFVFMRAVLGVAGYMACSLMMQAVMLIIGVPIVVVGALVGLGLQAAGVSTAVLVGLGITAGGLLFLVLMVYAMPIALGPIFTFMQAYTLYFLGGRYPMVGELLAASEPPPPLPIGYPYPPPSYPPAPAV